MLKGLKGYGDVAVWVYTNMRDTVDQKGLRVWDQRVSGFRVWAFRANAGFRAATYMVA